MPLALVNSPVTLQPTYMAVPCQKTPEISKYSIVPYILKLDDKVKMNYITMGFIGISKHNYLYLLCFWESSITLIKSLDVTATNKFSV